MSSTNPTTLTQTFHHSTQTHTYTITYQTLGNPAHHPLIFIHGTPWSSHVWSPLALALSRTFRVYIFDNPGFGDSPLEQPLPGVTFNPASEVEKLDGDLARQSEVFAALFKMWEREEGWGGRRPHVVAHDHGGLMGLRGCMVHGCRYESLCLVDVVAIGPFGHSLFNTMAESPEYFQKLPDMVFDGILESYIRNAAFTEVPKELMQTLKAPWLREGGKEGFIRQMCQANVRNNDAVEARFGEVGREIPVKIIWGEQDNWIPVETAKRLGDALHAKEVVMIEHAGHLIMYDQPAQLGVELGQWLS